MTTAVVSTPTLSTAPAGTPGTMLAAVYRGVNDIRTEEIAIPEIGPGEVLLRIDSCGICGTDLKKIHTGSHAAPRVFGHEMAGTVAAVGAGVTKFAVGDRAMTFHHIPCGACYYVCAVRALQRGGHDGGTGSGGRWWICRVHSRDGLDR